VPGGVWFRWLGASDRLLLHPPVQLLPAVIGGSRNLQGWADVGDAQTLIKKLISCYQLADDLLGTVAYAFHGASPGISGQWGSSHKVWFSFRGPRQDRAWPQDINLLPEKQVLKLSTNAIFGITSREDDPPELWSHKSI